VVTYERDAEFAEVARENMALGGVEDAVDIRTGDVLEHLDDLESSSFDVHARSIRATRPRWSSTRRTCSLTAGSSRSTARSSSRRERFRRRLERSASRTLPLERRFSARCSSTNGVRGRRPPLSATRDI